MENRPYVPPTMNPPTLQKFNNLFTTCDIWRKTSEWVVQEKLNGFRGAFTINTWKADGKNQVEVVNHMYHQRPLMLDLVKVLSEVISKDENFENFHNFNQSIQDIPLVLEGECIVMDKKNHTPVPFATKIDFAKSYLVLHVYDFVDQRQFPEGYFKRLAHLERAFLNVKCSQFQLIETKQLPLKTDVYEYLQTILVKNPICEGIVVKSDYLYPKPHPHRDMGHSNGLYKIKNIKTVDMAIYYMSLHINKRGNLISKVHMGLYNDFQQNKFVVFKRNAYPMSILGKKDRIERDAACEDPEQEDVEKDEEGGSAMSELEKQQMFQAFIQNMGNLKKEKIPDGDLEKMDGDETTNIALPAGYTEIELLVDKIIHVPSLGCKLVESEDNLPKQIWELFKDKVPVFEIIPYKDGNIIECAYQQCKNGAFQELCVKHFRPDRRSPNNISSIEGLVEKAKIVWVIEKKNEKSYLNKAQGESGIKRQDQGKEEKIKKAKKEKKGNPQRQKKEDTVADGL